MCARISFLAILTTFLSFISTGQIAGAAVASFEKHDIRITLDVPVQQATITDKGEVQIDKGWNLFYLCGSAKIGSLFIAGSAVDYRPSDFDQAHPAHANGFHFGVIAENGDIDADLFGCVHNQRPSRNAYLDPIDCQCHQISHSMLQYLIHSVHQVDSVPLVAASKSSLKRSMPLRTGSTANSPSAHRHFP